MGPELLTLVIRLAGYICFALAILVFLWESENGRWD